MYRQLVITFLLLVVLSAKLWSQATIDAQAFAVLVEAMNAIETDQLNFGRFSTGIHGGDITIHPDGSRILLGSVTAVAGSYGPGVFEVTGAPGASFTIQLPQAPAVLFHQESSKTMLVEDWVTDPSLENGPVTLIDGQRVISLGATLSVGSYDDNPVGIYTGTFQLVFAYN